MTKLEAQPFFPPADKEILATSNVFPRRDAMELLNLLQFHQAVIDSAGVGIIIVDNDTRIINANRMAREIIGKSSADVVNCPVGDIFNNGDRIKMTDGLKQVIQQTELSIASFYSTFHSHVVGTIISPIMLHGKNVGWVVSLAPALQSDEQAF
jgi:PAS domain S-box-containing protein